MRLIVTADWHLRKELPSCRNDKDWIEYQGKVIQFILDKAYELKSKLCIVGDIFDKAKDDIVIVNLLLKLVKNYYDEGKLENVYVIAGNHDLLYHSSLDLDKTLFGAIYKNQIFKDLSSLGLTKHYGEKDFRGDRNSDIMFLHEFVYNDSSLSFFNKGYSVQELLEEHKSIKWFFVGDNHKGFIYQNKNRYVVNPGCILIQERDMIDYAAGIYFVDTEKEEIKRIEVPDFGSSFVDIQSIKKTESNINSFIELIRDKKEISFDFVSNLKKEMMNIKDKKLYDFLDSFIKDL